MRKLTTILVCFLLLVLTGCFPPPNQLRAVIRTVPSPPRGPYTLEWEFDGRASRGEIEQYLWVIADEADEVIKTDEGPVVHYEFDRPGKYTVYLTVLSPRISREYWLTG